MRRLSVGLALCAATLGAQAPAPYHVSQTYPLGGDGSWDYVVPDPAHHRVFIGRQTRVMVVDENDGKLLGEVPASTVRTAPRSPKNPDMGSRPRAMTAPS